MTHVSKIKTLAAAAVVAMAGSGASASVIFFDDFENPTNLRNWQVYTPIFGDWSVTAGAGIEVQTNGTVAGVTAHSGNQYIELDSDTARGGTPGSPTNSSMTRYVDLAAGRYRLEWYYQPRTGAENDNTITAYIGIGGANANLFVQAIGSGNAKRIGTPGWERIVYDFSVDGKDNLYSITFQASGTQNSLGGFLDSATLSQVPLPAAAWMLLAGLGGLAAVGRRRQKS